MQGDARRCTLSFLESQPAQIVQILGEEVWTRQQRPRTQRGNTGGTIQVVPYRWYHLERFYGLGSVCELIEVEWIPWKAEEECSKKVSSLRCGPEKRGEARARNVDNDVSLCSSGRSSRDGETLRFSYFFFFRSACRLANLAS
jgi:hypothetical protein